MRSLAHAGKSARTAERNGARREAKREGEGREAKGGDKRERCHLHLFFGGRARASHQPVSNLYTAICARFVNQPASKLKSIQAHAGARSLASAALVLCVPLSR